jgi:DNA repair protein RadA/Sms
MAAKEEFMRVLIPVLLTIARIVSVVVSGVLGYLYVENQNDIAKLTSELSQTRSQLAEVNQKLSNETCLATQDEETSRSLNSRLNPITADHAQARARVTAARGASITFREPFRQTQYNYLMAKTHTRFVCQQCGRVSATYMGKCPQCGSFDSMVEEIVHDEPVSKGPASNVRGLTGRSQPRPIGEIGGEAEDRIPLPIGEFARVLGGGIVPGSIVLVGGDPGIGKSSLLLQMAIEMAGTQRVLYVSGEESERQIKMRASRFSASAASKSALPKNLLLVTETNLEVIFNHVADVKPELLIVDSIQTVYLSELDSSAGSVSQVRECASQLRELAKSSGISIFIVGHVTKEGNIAGPRVLEHIVDTVLYLEGDRFQAYRLLRSVKNRFGATSEVGVFQMREQGLIEVTNPSEAFLAERLVNAPGSSIAVTMEGTRPILVEIQGLTSPTQFGNARRTPNGVDFNRLLLIAAVLTRRVGLKLGEQDIFVNVVGGIQIDEPAADLAIAAAIASSWKDVSVRAEAVLIGEIGLAGELRMPGQMQTRLKEAAKLGFKTAIVPKAVRQGESWPKGIEVIEARSIQQALDAAFVEGHEPAKGRKVA